MRTKGRENDLLRVYPKPWFAEAPYVLAVCAVPAEAWARSRFDGWSAAETDATIATDHMLLAAADLGLGTCWVAAFDPAAARDVLGLPDGAVPRRVHSARLAGGRRGPEGAKAARGDRSVRPLVEGRRDVPGPGGRRSPRATAAREAPFPSEGTGTGPWAGRFVSNQPGLSGEGTSGTGTKHGRRPPPGGAPQSPAEAGSFGRFRRILRGGSSSDSETTFLARKIAASSL